ncbi:MAG: type II toxin-antitoxin system VapC family toxin [Bacteroidota bacterium]|nr:type II toxin-antitoxin system VapC family toxin [Bacteroidota bacterium]
MTARKIVVDTDVLADHLVQRNGVSILRAMMGSYFCYTTVFNAIELFALAKSGKEIRAVADAMDAMKILGVNSKSAAALGRLLARTRARNIPDSTALIAGVCIESKLPIVTLNPKRFFSVKEVKVLHARALKFRPQT